MITQEDEINIAIGLIYSDWSRGSVRDPFRLIDKALRRGVEIGKFRTRRAARVGLTAQQRSLLDFITRFITEHEVPPSFDEMKDALGLHSKSGIHRLVTALEERGAIIRLPNRARAIGIPAAA